MGSFKTFLESSTIHGLGYIATTGRYVKLFWVLVGYGYSEIELPSDYPYFGSQYNYAAISGTISSQHFGEKFDADRVLRKLKCNFYVYPPNEIKDNPNVSLHYIIEKISMKGLTIAKDQR